jgi:transposase
VLEEHGFRVILVNARYAKNVPGRKTDVNDAAWLQRLHSYGLLRGSFRPEAGVATLRAYLRQRERLIEYCASHIQHMQKALMEMNVQLHHVVSDVTGATGMRIIRAIVAGERAPDTLAAMRDIRCHASAEKICAALSAPGVMNTSLPSRRLWSCTISIRRKFSRAIESWSKRSKRSR